MVERPDELILIFRTLPPPNGERGGGEMLPDFLFLSYFLFSLFGRPREIDWPLRFSG